MSKRVQYVDFDGRIWVRAIPDQAAETQEEAERGVPIGPPSLASLGLPLSLEVRLHNELAKREILTLEDAMKRGAEIHAALMVAMTLDRQAIQAVYAEEAMADT